MGCSQWVAESDPIGYLARTFHCTAVTPLLIEHITVEKSTPTAAPHPPRRSTHRSARTPLNFFPTRIKGTTLLRAGPPTRTPRPSSLLA